MQDRNAPFLSNSDIAELTEWRRELHRKPELSGQERTTAATVSSSLAQTGPNELLTELGGHGVAAIYCGQQAGPTVMLRCELDALPIRETGDVPYKSEIDGKGHLCGHDGHMAIIAGVARWLAKNPPKCGRVVLLFQPAEEDGAGAKRVIKDAGFAAIAPDFALSLHNYPGIPIGQAALAAGPMNCASRGMKICLTGRTAHASEPENGLSPALAVSSLISDLTALKRGAISADPEFALATVTHANLGEAAFGIAPGAAQLWVTLRTQLNDTMDQLVADAEALVSKVAQTHGLTVETSYHDVFLHCENHPDATDILAQALEAEAIPFTANHLPLRASEDFGRYGDYAKSAMFLLGSGPETANLHNPDYDFPDALIPIGARVFIRALASVLY